MFDNRQIQSGDLVYYEGVPSLATVTEARMADYGCYRKIVLIRVDGYGNDLFYVDHWQYIGRRIS